MVNSNSLTYRCTGSSPSHVVLRQSSDGTVICAGSKCNRSADPIAQKLYETVKKVYEFFSHTYCIHGIDDKGEMVPVYLHLEKRNAYWGCKNNSCQLSFHDDYAIKPEVVAHEFTHGIIARLCPLAPTGQPGALNESLADVFGICFKQLISKNANDWDLGGLRKLSSCIGMHDYKQGSHDNGYVHANSRIPSHAFYSAVQLSYGEYSSIDISQIWARAMRFQDYNETFEGFARKTLKVSSWYNLGNLEICISKAWIHVGVLPQPIPRPLSYPANHIKYLRSERSDI